MHLLSNILFFLSSVHIQKQILKTQSLQNLKINLNLLFYPFQHVFFIFLLLLFALLRPAFIRNSPHKFEKENTWKIVFLFPFGFISFFSEKRKFHHKTQKDISMWNSLISHTCQNVLSSILVNFNYMFFNKQHILFLFFKHI